MESKLTIRVIVCVQDGNGNRISTDYNAQHIIINFPIMRDRAIEDMVELSYQNDKAIKIIVIISVDDCKGNRISAVYSSQDVITNFIDIQDKIIEDMEELSYKNKEQIRKNIIEIKPRKLCKNEE